MRKIKFRGLSSGKKEWIYGWYVADNTTDYAWIINYGGLVFTGEENRIEVIKETVGQFTGLLDKNSKEIFDGDIDSRGLIVEYLVNMSGYYLLNSNKEGYHLCHEQNVLGGKIKHIEIIGNLYETPELLK